MLLILGEYMDNYEYISKFDELSVPDAIEQHDTYLELYDAISKLDIKDQFIVALISSGYTRIEGGRIVGITRNAVGKRYSKALRRLKEILEEENNIYAIP